MNESFVADDGIAADSVVDEIILRFPSAALVFVRHHMHCVGCELAPFETIASAARVYHQSPASLVADLRAAAACLSQRKDGPAGQA